MRLGLHRSKIHIFPRKYRMKNTVLLVFILTLVVFTYISVLFLFRVQPVFVTRASSYVSNMANSIINNSIVQVFDEEIISYNDLVNINYDGNDNIASISANISRINYLKSKIATTIQNNIDENEYGEIAIPFGSVIDNNLFQGLGPKISITVAPVGMTKVDFADEFISTGINQVKHKIYFDISVTISLISSTMEKSETVTNRVLIAETVIVGNIPNYYLDKSSISDITDK